LFNVDLACHIVCHRIIGLVICFELYPHPSAHRRGYRKVGHSNLLKVVHQPRCVGNAFLICIMQAFGKYLIDDLIFAFEEFSQDLAETDRRNTIVCDDRFYGLELRSSQRKAGYISGL
jgi:hypothetical protein